MADQQGVIEQLLAENAILRAALQNAPSRELQIAAAMDALLFELTKMGRAPTARVLNYVFSRHFEHGKIVFGYEIVDRRPKPAPPEAAPVIEMDGRKHPVKNKMCDICGAGPFTANGITLHKRRIDHRQSA